MYKQYIPDLLISFFGGVVAFLVGDSNNLTMVKALSRVSAAVLAGFIVNSVYIYLEYPEGLRPAVLALTGYCANNLLRALSKRFLDKIDKEVNNDNRNDI